MHVTKNKTVTWVTPEFRCKPNMGYEDPGTSNMVKNGEIMENYFALLYFAMTMEEAQL